MERSKRNRSRTRATVAGAGVGLATIAGGWTTLHVLEHAERIRALEVRQDAADQRIGTLSTWLERIEGKLDRVLSKR